MINRPKILLVDDNLDILKMIKSQLSKDEFNVDMAFDGAEAIEKIKKNRPSVLVSDWMMPKINGVDLCREVKNKKEFESIYFIMLTAKNDLDDKRLAFEVGADDYVEKPFNPTELILRIKAGIRICRLHENIADRAHLKAIRELALTLGHEINNPLGVMLLILQSIQKKNDTTTLNQLKKEIEECIHQGGRISEVIKKLSSLENPIFKPYLDGSDLNMLDLK